LEVDYRMLLIFCGFSVWEWVYSFWMMRWQIWC